MKSYKLTLLAFDGAKVQEGSFNTIDKAWDYCNELGSKWYFYPFCFVTTDKTIIDTPELLNHLKGKRIKTVCNRFKLISELPENEGATVEDFMFAV